MTKYREDLIEKVRNGEAQIRVDQHEVWNDLLNYTFPLRKQDEVSFVFYSYYDRGVEYLGSNEPRYDMPIIPAKDFLIQESEDVNWVEVIGDNKKAWIIIEEDGSNLPKEPYGYYHVFSKEPIFVKEPKNQGIEEFWINDENKTKEWLREYSHYQPIIKPESPIW